MGVRYQRSLRLLQILVILMEAQRLARMDGGGRWWVVVCCWVFMQQEESGRLFFCLWLKTGCLHIALPITQSWCRIGNPGNGEQWEPLLGAAEEGLLQNLPANPEIAIACTGAADFRLT